MSSDSESSKTSSSSGITSYLSEGISSRSFRSRPQESQRPFQRVPSVPPYYPQLSASSQVFPFFLTAAGRLSLQTCYLQASARLPSAIPEAHCALSVPFPGPSESLVGPLQPVCRQVFPFFFTAAPFLSPPFYFLFDCLPCFP